MEQVKIKKELLENQKYRIDDPKEVEDILSVFCEQNFRYFVVKENNKEYFAIKFLVHCKCDPRITKYRDMKPHGQELMLKNKFYWAIYVFEYNSRVFDRYNGIVEYCEGWKCRYDLQDTYCESCFGEFGLNNYLDRYRPSLKKLLGHSVDYFNLSYKIANFEDITEHIFSSNKKPFKV